MNSARFTKHLKEKSHNHSIETKFRNFHLNKKKIIFRIYHTSPHRSPSYITNKFMKNNIERKSPGKTSTNVNIKTKQKTISHYFAGFRKISILYWWLHGVHGTLCPPNKKIIFKFLDNLFTNTALTHVTSL